MVFVNFEKNLKQVGVLTTSKEESKLIEAGFE